MIGGVNLIGDSNKKKIQDEYELNSFLEYLVDNIILKDDELLKELSAEGGEENA